MLNLGPLKWQIWPARAGTSVKKPPQAADPVQRGKAGRAWQRQSAYLWLRGILLGLATSLAFLFGLFEAVERWGLNEQFHLRGPVAPKSPIVIVSIDEDSFDELNLPWPWPRALHAQFLDMLSVQEPAVIGFDILFAEPSMFGPDDDQALGEAVGRAGNVVLAAAMTVVEGVSYTKEDLNPPINPIRERAAGFGPVNFVTDDDAFVRTANLKRTYQGKELAYFNLQIYRLALKAGIAARPIEESRFLINYRGGPKTFTTVPYYRVLYGEVAPDVFAGKIVLVGSTSPVLHDVFPTPFAPEGGMPGVEIHANVLETLLEGIPLRRIPWPVTVLLILASSVLAFWLANRMRPLYALGAILGTAGVYAAAGFVAFVWGHFWLDMAPIPVALTLGYGASVLENFIREQREKRRLARFFSPAVVKEIIRHRSDQALGSSRRRITVLFSDIRGFTSISEKLPPEQVVEILTEYLTELTDVVFRHGGMVDKYVGDCIMALYNVPLEDPDHAARAVRTALEFQKRTQTMSARWEARLGVQVKNGVGVNTGDAVVGTMGSRQRLEYTAIGDTVNLAARLESITKEYRSPIIISESTYQEIRGRFRTKCLGQVTVKGKEIPVRIYAVEAAVEANIRKEVRLPVETNVAISDGEFAFLGSASDLSQGGISVHNLRSKFPGGQPAALTNDLGRIMQLHLDLPAASHPIGVTGRVAWSAEDKAGFHFQDFEPGAEPAIEEFVSLQSSFSGEHGPEKG